MPPMALLYLVLTCGVNKVSTNVGLSHVSTIYLPFMYTDSKPTFDIRQDAAAQSSYDAARGVVYTVGYSGVLHVIDVTNVNNLNIIHKLEFHDFYKLMATDVQVCGSYVAVTLQHKEILDNGTLRIYTAYNRMRENMNLLREETIGVFPTQLVFTKDCTILLTANEGRLTKSMLTHTPYHDAEGTISIIKFSTGDLGYGPATVKTLDFKRFNARSAEYVSKGVRFLYNGLEQTDLQSTFSQDMEPEYITINAAETKAYVCLQENNAVAMVDIATESIDEIHPLGYKDWSQYKLDASDVDGVRMYGYEVYGMYQPDNIKYFTWDDKEFIVSANEGDGKAYRVDSHGLTWSETIRGQVFSKESLIDDSVSEDLKRDLRDPKKLGNLVFSFKDGEVKDSATNKFSRFYTYGGRSFSIWDAQDLSLVFDSGSDVEEKHSERFPNIFNSHIESETHTPTTDMDTRSDDKGPEPETVEVVPIDERLYFFIGNERTSTIMIYSMGKGSTVPVFESIYRSGLTNSTWRDLYENREIGDIDLEDMLYIPYDQSPNCKPLLLVIGSVSGTMSLYEVTGLPEPTNPKCLTVTKEPPLTTKSTVTTEFTTPRSAFTSTTTATMTTTKTAQGTPSITDRIEVSSSNSPQQAVIIAVSLITAVVVVAIIGALLGFLYFRNRGDIRNMAALNKGVSSSSPFDNRTYMEFQNESASDIRKP